MFKQLLAFATQTPGRFRVMATLVAAGLGAANGHAQVVNGDFSKPAIRGPLQMVQNVEGWTTTDIKKEIEIWADGASVGGGPKFNAPPGIKQFAEVNANSSGKLSQDVSIPAGSQYGFSFWHRGRHSATEPDTIEVTVKDGAQPEWKRTFSTTNRAWQQYTVAVGTKKGPGKVALSFRAVSTASKDDTIGNFLTGVKLDASVKPPPCVQNAAGQYSWFSSAQPNATNMLPMGTTILNADGTSRNLRGNPEKDFIRGVWQVNSNCEVVITWNKGQYVDTLTVNPDGKQMKGFNQKKQVLRGDRK